MSTRLSGLSALITGGSRGIGRAVALQFAREGADVAFSHLGDGAHAQSLLAELRAIRREGPSAPQFFAFDSDAGNGAAVTQLVQDAIASLGKLDCLINNVGIQVPTLGENFDEADYSRILAVNLTGAALACRAALAHFLVRGGGCIINTSSVHETIPKPGYLAYSVSKGGLGNLTRTLALEFAARHIRVNSVAPGAITTDMNAAWVDDAAIRAKVESHIPMQRAASADEIAPVFAFLASREASYITGQTLNVCGGLTLYGDFQTNWAS